MNGVQISQTSTDSSGSSTTTTGTAATSAATTSTAASSTTAASSSDTSSGVSGQLTVNVLLDSKVLLTMIRNASFNGNLVISANAIQS
jgi:hypothetical protein